MTTEEHRQGKENQISIHRRQDRARYKSHPLAITQVQALQEAKSHLGSPAAHSGPWGWPVLLHPRAYLHPDGLVRHAAHHVADGSEQLQQGLHEVRLPFVFIESTKEHTTLDGAWQTGPCLYLLLHQEPWKVLPQWQLRT